MNRWRASQNDQQYVYDQRSGSSTQVNENVEEDSPVRINQYSNKYTADQSDFVNFDSNLTPSNFYEQEAYGRVDSQFQPPFQNEMYHDYQQQQQDPAQEIDQKIMENIQKYITHFMTNQSQVQQPPPQSYQPQQPQVYHQPQQQYQPPQQDHFYSQQQPLIREERLKPVVEQTHTLKSDEFLFLKQHIESLTSKIDSMQHYTSNLQATIESKDRELQKVRSIYNMKGHRVLPQQEKPKVKKEKGCQTIVNLLDNQREYETFSYLYDKDQDLLKSEKQGLLKYMRKEVVQNQEFLDRIRDLEYEREELIEQLMIYQRQDTQKEESVQENETIQEVVEEETSPMKTYEDKSITCQILNPKQVTDLQQEVELLTVHVQEEQSRVRVLEQKVASKQEELDAIADSTNHKLYVELSLVRQQLQQKQQDIEGYQSEIMVAKRDRDAAQSELEGLKQRVQELEKYFNEELMELRNKHQNESDKLRQERASMQQYLKDSDSKNWDLTTKLEEQKKLIVELEASQDKKNKKKKIECVNCLKKDAELQQFTLKIDKVHLSTNVQQLKLDMNGQQGEYEKMIKQKEMQIKDSQTSIESLQRQVKNSIVNIVKSASGNLDPQIQSTLQRLSDENDEKNKLIDQLKLQMEKQAKSFMDAMTMQQQMPLSKSQPKK